MKATIIPSLRTSGVTVDRVSVLARLGRRILLSGLSRIEHGELCVVEDGAMHRFGRVTSEFPQRVTLTVLDPQFYAHTSFGGTVGVGESFINDHWRCDNLTGLVQIIIGNSAMLDRVDSGVARIGQPLLRIAHWFSRNSRKGSERNIAAHYDLGNDLYKLMLDETMAYSCGIFASHETTLAEASRAKFDAACRKLSLKPGDELLEIGTGWGGLAVYAAQNYGCHVTTTTISREQYAYSVDLVASLGLRDRVKVLLEDYRALTGRFDKLVSIEMIEAVGARYLDTYLAKCSSLLKNNGAMLLQSITLQDQYYRKALRTVDFIQRFVFPGSFIPSINAIADSLRRVTDMKVFHMEDIGPHYARTLATWRENFFRNLNRVKELGYPDSFVRLWDFYLSYCEAGFAARRLGDVQLLLTRPGYRGAVA
jgi:cyclopropane-fatty-acyl-phospholipid synthase